jgi:hypothetical protein
MLRVFPLLIALGAAFQTTSGVAQLGPEGCATPLAFTAQLDGIERTLSAVMLHVESVPPKDAEFLEREITAAYTLGDRARFNAAYQNTYFHAFQVHKVHGDVASNLKLARENQNQIQKRSLALVDSLVSLAEFTSTMSEYLGSTHRTGNRVQAMAFDVASLRSAIGRALKCNIRLMTPFGESSAR